MNPFYPEIPALGAEAQAQARTQFRDYMDRIIGPRAGAFDSSQSLPREVIVDLGKQGYLGALVPSRFGGAGMNMTTLGLLHEETGRACSSVRSLLTVQSMVAAALLRCGSHQQQETWLPALASGSKIAVFGLTEAGAGSDARACPGLTCPGLTCTGGAACLYAARPQVADVAQR